MTQGRILSGIQPTGSIHIGNYLGAIHPWTLLQHEQECFFCIVDYHAITVPQDNGLLPTHIRNTAAAYIACGIDPTRATIFVQSEVVGHTELGWIFNCMTPIGWINRMTQFKEKSQKQKDNANLGLLAYPVLQAADILLYHATHVPVGEDQKQHLELTRDIALSFNHRYDRSYFTPPEVLIPKQAGRIMSLRDGTQKMSKSDSSEASRIHIFDSNDAIAVKIRRAKSDSDSIQPEGLDQRPEAMNLLSLYAHFTQQPLEQAVAHFTGLGFSELKKELTEAVIAQLSPIREQFLRLQSDARYLGDILDAGRDRASAIATTTLDEVKSIVGLNRS